MKPVSIIVFIGLIVLHLYGICIADDYTFRKAKWGMSKEEVKMSEQLKVAEEDDNFLVYKTSIIGKDVFVVYFFIDKQLTRARYVLAESHSNKNDFISDYNNFKEILIKKYGNPLKDESFWKNDLFKDDYSSWGTAISVGHLVYLSNWETKDTEITNILSGENYDISCIIEYRSTNLKEIEKKSQEKKALEAF